MELLERFKMKLFTARLREGREEEGGGREEEGGGREEKGKEKAKEEGDIDW